MRTVLRTILIIFIVIHLYKFSSFLRCEGLMYNKLHLFIFIVGIQMLTLLVPILINYLLEEEQLQQGTKYQISLHQHSFQWLNKIGPKYPKVQQ